MELAWDDSSALKGCYVGAEVAKVPRLFLGPLSRTSLEEHESHAGARFCIDVSDDSNLSLNYGQPTFAYLETFKICSQRRKWSV